MGASKIVVTGMCTCRSGCIACVHQGNNSAAPADLVESKLVMALRMGATHTINSTGLGQGDMAVRVKEAIGAQCDITIECTGVEGSVRAAVSVCG
jgi:Zn-dependent alcohol dehydrogenase